MKRIRSNEEGNAMPSVRSRIKQFESLSGENDKSNEEPNRANKREYISNIVLSAIIAIYNPLACAF